MALAQSKVTSQGQISVPLEVRKRLGVGPGSVLEWDEQGGAVVVRRAGKVSSEEIHSALFPKAPQPKSLSDLKDLFAAICRIVREVLRLKSTSIDLYDHERRTFRRLALDYPDAKGPLGQDAERPLDNSPAAQAILSMQPILFGPDTLDQFSSDIMIPLAEEGLRSGCCLPLVAHGKLLGAIGLASKREAVFIREDLSFLSQVADQIAIAVENALAYELRIASWAPIRV